MQAPPGPGFPEALAAERGFVRMLGGYTVGLPGGTLLVNERIPEPRFNAVQEVTLAPERQTEFYETALDHYFQRALRPTFRVTLPVPAHVDAGLRRFAFLPREGPEVWLVAGPDRPAPPPAPPGIRRARPEELDRLIPLWIGAPYRLELRRRIEVGWNHPNPSELLQPFLREGDDGSVVSAGLAYRRGPCLDLEQVVTVPDHRGVGAATSLVDHILEDPLGRDAAYVAIRSAEPRLAEHLAPHGFRVAEHHRVYDLPPDAKLQFPVGPSPSGPIWRPPRGDPGATTSGAAGTRSGSSAGSSRT